MSQVLGKKSLLKKAGEVGISTFLSRILGIVREVLLVKYLGQKILLDAFATAYKIPNSLRKIFSEGALSAAFVPTFVRMKKKGQSEEINSLMTLSFLVVEGLLIALCFFMMWHADWLFRIIAPGWFVGTQSATLLGFPVPAAWLGYGEPIMQVTYAIDFFRILIALIVFLSSSSLLASALQSVHHFFIPAISPLLLNAVFVGGLLAGLVYGLPPAYLCFFIVFGGFLQFLLHLFVYFKYHFTFGPIKESTYVYFKEVMGKFFPCLFSMSIMEISLFIDTSFASYLPKGSIYLIYLANRFMGIPQGVFATAFSTILLPHFARINIYAPKRLSFYLLEVTKFVAWVTIPVSIVMSFFAENIFQTLFSFSPAQISEASAILMTFLLGLFFFAINKILLNLYYAIHNTKVPGWITVLGTAVNITLNWLLITSWQATGLAFATVCSTIFQTILFILVLRFFFDFKFYTARIMSFLIRYIVQLTLVLGVSWYIYRALHNLISLLPGSLATFFLYKIGFWLWVGPICLVAGLVLYYTRRIFGVRLYFLD